MQQVEVDYEWKRSTPEAQQMTSSSILRFLRRIEEDELELHSLMIVRNGHVTAEGAWAPYRAELPHLLNSLSKSFTSTAIGLAIDEGKLSLSDRVISFFPEEVTPEIADNMKDLEIRHLLTMSTGHTRDTFPVMTNSPHGNWAKAFLQTPIECEPGTHFLYNTGATYMLSAILHKATGEQLLDYLQPRLFAPLGITGVRTQTCPRGIHAGGIGMYMKVKDIAKFGQLYLQEGVWEGRRILSREWVQMATAGQIESGVDPASDWAQGYGFQFWRCRNGAYRGDGAFGQLCIVIPDKQAVVAVTSGVMEMQDVMDAVWEELLPGMLDAPIREPDEQAQEELAQRLRSLSYPAARSDRALDVPLPADITYRAADNEAGIRTLKFQFADDGAALEIEDADGPQLLRIGHGEWKDSELRIAGRSGLVSACGRRVKRGVYEIDLRFLEHAFHDRVTCHFVKHKLRISAERNVWGFTPGLTDFLQLPTLMAAAEQR